MDKDGIGTKISELLYSLGFEAEPDDVLQSDTGSYDYCARYVKEPYRVTVVETVKIQLKDGSPE